MKDKTDKTDKTEAKPKASPGKPRTEIVPAGERPTSARCDQCLFGRTVAVLAVKGKDATRLAERCECHVARPSGHGFPCVRRDDWCSLHVSAETQERTFGGLVAQGFQ
jgi:hypothetical protein